jgi:hypothetical protein
MDAHRADQGAERGSEMSDKYLLKDGVEAYLKKLADDGASAATQATYRRCLRIAVDHFGDDRDLKRMIPAHVARFFGCDAVAKKPDGSARAKLSVSQIRRAFRQMLAHAHEAGRIEAVPLPRSEQG